MRKYIFVFALLIMMVGVIGCSSDEGNHANPAAANVNHEEGNGDEQGTNENESGDKEALNLPNAVHRTPDSEFGATLEIGDMTEFGGFDFTLTANAYDTNTTVEGTTFRNHEHIWIYQQAGEDGLCEVYFTFEDGQVTVEEKGECEFLHSNSYLSFNGNYYEGEVPESEYEALESKTYAKSPVTIAKREEVLYENAKGQFILLGEKIDDEKITIYYKVTGDLIYSSSQYPGKVKYIFDNGFSKELHTDRSINWFIDGDEKYMYNSASIKPEDLGTPVRVDFVDDENEENNKTIMLEDQGEISTPAVHILPLKLYDELNIEKKSSDLNLTIHSIDLRDEKNIHISATLEALEDMVVDMELSCLVNSIWDDCANGKNVELYQGIPLNVDLTIDKKHFNHHTYQTGFRIAGFPIYFDLAEGKEVEDNTIYHYRQPNIFGYEDASGERYYQAIQLQNESRSTHQIRGLGYKTLTFKIAKTETKGFWNKGDLVEFQVIGIEKPRVVNNEEVSTELLNVKIPADEYEGGEYTVNIEGYNEIRIQGGYYTPYLIIYDVVME